MNDLADLPDGVLLDLLGQLEDALRARIAPESACDVREPVASGVDWAAVYDEARRRGW